MNTYISQFFVNGRIAVVPTKDFDEAIEQNKEILVFCGGWSGGYACAIFTLIQESAGTCIPMM